jgi:hypothetical protein
MSHTPLAVARTTETIRQTMLYATMFAITTEQNVAATTISA